MEGDVALRSSAANDPSQTGHLYGTAPAVMIMSWAMLEYCPELGQRLMHHERQQKLQEYGLTVVPSHAESSEPQALPPKAYKNMSVINLTPAAVPA